MSHSDWVLLCVCQDTIQASLIIVQLEELSIPVVMLNQKDSSYGLFGEIRIMVPKKELFAAQGLLMSMGFSI